jgi:hypothetical protein
MCVLPLACLTSCWAILPSNFALFAWLCVCACLFSRLTPALTAHTLVLCHTLQQDPSHKLLRLAIGHLLEASDACHVCRAARLHHCVHLCRTHRAPPCPLLRACMRAFFALACLCAPAPRPYTYRDCSTECWQAVRQVLCGQQGWLVTHSNQPTFVCTPFLPFHCVCVN